MNTTHKHNTPREFVTYIGYIVSYLAVALSGMSFAFALLNVIFPEVGSYTSLGYTDVFSALGIFTTAVIVFLVMVYVVVRLVKQGGTHPDSRVRTWTLYIGQFIGYVTLAVTLAIAIKYFFGGEFTVRFALKSLVVLLIGIDAVLFFRHELSRTDKTPAWVSMVMSVAAGVIVIVSIIGTFMYLGTPNIARSIKHDEQRVSDLQALGSNITNWYQSHGSLPTDLATLKKQDYYQEPRDPQYAEGRVYTYQVTDAKKLSYEICGTFDLGSDNKFVVRKDRATGGNNYPYSPRANGVMTLERRFDSGEISETNLDNPWHHGVGNHCYTKTIDTKQYPIFEKPIGTRSVEI
jgi:hypothetical protein